MRYATRRHERPNRPNPGPEHRCITGDIYAHRSFLSRWIEANLRPRNFCKRLSFVSGPAARRENHTAVVRRRRRRLDRLPALLPGRSSARIFLFAFALAKFPGEGSEPDPWRPARREPFRI